MEERPLYQVTAAVEDHEKVQNDVELMGEPECRKHVTSRVLGCEYIHYYHDE